MTQFPLGGPSCRIRTLRHNQNVDIDSMRLEKNYITIGDLCCSLTGRSASLPPCPSLDALWPFCSPLLHFQFWEYFISETIQYVPGESGLFTSSLSTLSLPHFRFSLYFFSIKCLFFSNLCLVRRIRNQGLLPCGGIAATNFETFEWGLTRNQVCWHLNWKICSL